MEELIVEAYRAAATKEFFAITIQVERLLKKQYHCQDPRRWVGTGEVRRALESKGLPIESPKDSA